ncbi:hypothetical protein, partial [Chitinophaga agrisoli]|uniref:hypothetical protein n=1 Tax=Chitinophaga agrisoli TaxID=2607653 RepID=UPI001BC8CA69
NAEATLAQELNTFYARFDSAANANGANTANGANIIPTKCTRVERARPDTAFIIFEHEVRTAFKRVNTRKAAGPDGITGRILKSCADQLAPVFTKIF